MNGPRRRLQWIPHLCSVLLVAWFWSQFAANSHLRTGAAAALSATQRPYVMNGLLIRLDRHVSEPFIPARQGYQLLFLTSDLCPHSRRQADNLRTLIEHGERFPFVILASFDSGAITHRPLAAALTARGIRYRRLHITNQPAFSEDTGLAWTPAIAVLDRDMRVRFVTEEITPTVVARLRELLGSEDPLS
jgi:hypothetical protein